VLTPLELNAWARQRVKDTVAGVRDPQITLHEGSAEAYALVDFAKVQANEERDANPILAKMLSGERPLRVAAHLESSRGRATVHLTRVEINSVAMTGSVLDLLVRAVFRPMFPEAHIDEPFDLADNVERIEVQATGVRVWIKKRR